jgi:hypothetical protein
MGDENVLLYVLVQTWIYHKNGSKWCVDISSPCELGGTPRTGSLEKITLLEE